MIQRYCTSPVWPPHPATQIARSESWRCIDHTEHPKGAVCFLCGGYFCGAHGFVCDEGHDLSCTRRDKP